MGNHSPRESFPREIVPQWNRPPGESPPGGITPRGIIPQGNHSPGESPPGESPPRGIIPQGNHSPGESSLLLLRGVNPPQPRKSRCCWGGLTPPSPERPIAAAFPTVTLLLKFKERFPYILGPRWPIGAPGGFLMPGCPDAWIARMAKIAQMAELDARMPGWPKLPGYQWPVAMASGHGQWPWPVAMASGHGQWPWP